MVTNSYRRILLGMWWLVAICIAIGLVSAFALDALQKHSFEATALVRVDVPADQGGASTSTSYDQTLATEADVALSNDVLALATSKSSNLTPLQMKAALHVSVITGTHVLKISASASSSELAMQIVSLDVQAIIAFENARIQQANTTREQNLKGQIAATQATVNTLTQQLALLKQQGLPETDATVISLTSQQEQATASLAQLRGNLVQLQYGESLAQPYFSVLQDALPDRTSHQLVTIKNTLLGGGVGFGLGVIFAAFVGSRRRLHGLGQVAPLADDAVLMEVPTLPDSVLRGNFWDDAHLASMFSVLRVDLTFLGSLQDLRSLAVLGVSPGAGASLVATLVAEQWARAGKRVLLVDTNTSASSQHVLHKLPLSPGLTDAVAAAQNANFDMRAYLQQTARPYTVLMAAGAQKSFSNRILTSPSFDLVMDALHTSNAELLVLDVPSLAKGQGSLQIARRADGVILVVDRAQCAAYKLESSLVAMREANINLAAIILNAPAHTRRAAKPVSQHSVQQPPTANRSTNDRPPMMSQRSQY